MSKSSVILPQREQNRFDPSPNQKARALTPQQNSLLGVCRQKTFCKLATSFLYLADHQNHLAAFGAPRREHRPSLLFKLSVSFNREMTLDDDTNTTAAPGESAQKRPQTASAQSCPKKSSLLISLITTPMTQRALSSVSRVAEHHYPIQMGKTRLSGLSDLPAAPQHLADLRAGTRARAMLC